MVRRHVGHSRPVLHHGAHGSIPGRGAGLAAKLAGRAQAMAARLRLYRRRHRERAQLLALTERERRDIGITRLDAVREAEKPFWR